MLNFNHGLSALRSSQLGLEVISNNIVNANTEGYHRRNIHLTELQPNWISGFRIGSGVAVGHIESVRNHITESALTEVTSDLSRVDQQINIESRVESTFLNGGQSLSSDIDALFAEISRLTSTPDEPAQKSAVIAAASKLADGIQRAAAQLASLKTSLRFQIQQEVESLNVDMRALSDTNSRIQTSLNLGRQASAELDQRDTLINRIAESIKITRSSFNERDLGITIGRSIGTHQGNKPPVFSVSEVDPDRIEFKIDDYDRPVDFASGKLVALQDAHNSLIPDYQHKLDQLAAALIANFDRIHATGVGTAGSFGQLFGTRAVADSDLPLEQAETAFPVSAGRLTVSIVDADGSRRLESLLVDPTVDSLSDIASKLSSIDGLQASVDPASQLLRIGAQAGLKFDFTANLETHPKPEQVSGTALPTLSGRYDGQDNQQLRFEVVGSGEIGISEGLRIHVISEGGDIERTIDVGAGYEPGSRLDIGQGVFLSLSSGTLLDGDSFTTPLVVEPDETGLLAALGLNAFFQGTDSRTIAVDNNLVRDQGRLASGHSGESADTTNLLRFVAGKQATPLPGNLGFAAFLDDTLADIGFSLQSNSALSDSLGSLKTSIVSERQAYSGVDVNEELIYMQQFQKSFEAAVRIVQTNDEMLQELFTILG